jgi:hypothetical protein
MYQAVASAAAAAAAALDEPIASPGHMRLGDFRHVCVGED